jgi:hypothetical protein
VTRRQPTAPIVLLGVAVTASVALLLAVTAGNTFFQDSWAFFFEREGNSPGDFLRPHNEHIVVIPVAIQKLLLALFGLSTELPEQLVLTVLLATTAVLVFVYVRRRVGEWPALIAAVIVLFLGPAWEVLLWPFEVSLLGSVTAGVAALVALDRNDRAGDIAACVLLVGSVGFSSLGVPFALAAAADVLVRFRDRGIARFYVAAVPLVVYAAWYVTYGHDTAAGSHPASLEDPLGVPRFTAEGVAASLSSILGLRTVAGGIQDGVDAPTLFLLALAALVVICVGVALLERRNRGTIRRQLRRSVGAGIWPVLTATVVFWGLAGLNTSGLRQPLESRYMYVGAILILLLAADLLVGMRIGRRALIAAGVATLVIVGLNLVPLFEGGEYLEEQTVYARADLGAIEIARNSVPPTFGFDPSISGTFSLINVKAGPYQSLVEEDGSPAYSPAELANAPEFGRRQADVILAHALPLTIETVPGRARGRAGDGCRRVAGGPGAPAVALEPGATTVELPAGRRAALFLRRFAATYPLAVRNVPAPSTTTIRFPPDRADRPWRLRIDANQGARVCDGSGSGQ